MSFITKQVFGEKKKEYLRAMDKQRGLIRELSYQLAALACIGIICNFIGWMSLCGNFPGKLWGSFRWFVIYPFVVQEVSVAAIILARKVINSRYKELTQKYYAKSAFIGTFFYALYFMSMVFFYQDVPVFWLFAICPMLVASFYINYRWLLTTLGYSLAFLAVIAVKILPNPYPIAVVPKFLSVLYVLAIGVIIAEFTIALHMRIEIMLEGFLKSEATAKAKGAFFAKMSHEIRTPINAVLGMDEMILREPVSPEVEEYALNIKNAGQSLLSIINDILDTSKLEADKLELVPVDYDLMSILGDCYNMVNIRAHDKGLELRVINDPSVPKCLHGDEVRIRQILTNLLTNGVKYTKVGYVELGVRWQKLDGDNMNLIFAVKDTGMGIAPDNLNSIFESFQRVDEKKNKYVEGTGLGLSISKQLIDMMHGTITVESKIDEGSVFTVSIPQKIVGTSALGDFYKSISNRTRVVDKYKEKFQAPDAKVLVVDDIQMNLDVFKGLLKKTQVQIDTALSGERALDLVNIKHYDIIFMDHLMPEMDGVETLNKIREMDTKNNETPIIALTANAGPDAERQYKEYGFTDYISKPVKGKHLEEIVLKYLQKERETNAIRKGAVAMVTEESGRKNFLQSLNFLDVVMGMSCCANDTKLYRDILSDYVADSKLEPIKEALAKKEWNEYKILVHALKSTSFSIGAVELSEEAKHLEVLVNERNYPEVEAQNNEVMRHYEQLMVKIDLALS